MFWNKTAKDLRVIALEEAEMSLTTQQAHFDYHAAMVGMYEKRVARLREEVQRDIDESRRAHAEAMNHG